MIMRTIEQQLKHNDCGLTAVKIICNLHKIKLSRDYIEDNIHLEEKGSSLHDIKKFFDEHQFTTKYNFLDLNTLRFNSNKLKELTPCILPVRHKQGLHYVVIKGIYKNKIQVLDPSRGQCYKWSFSELMKQAHIASQNFEGINNREALDQMISDELALYGLTSEELFDQDQAMIINKLTYFTYIKEYYGFSSEYAEKEFLKDLIFNLQLNALPEQFKALKFSRDKLTMKAPVVLTVNSRTETVVTTPKAKEEEKPVHPYRRLFNELKQYHNLWSIFVVSALIVALLGQVTVFTSQILIDNVLPNFDNNLLILFALGMAVFRVFHLAVSSYKSFIAIHLSNILDSYFLSSFIGKLNTFSIRYIQSFSKGDLSERIKDSLRLKTFFMRFLTPILIDSFVTAYSLCVLFIIDWKVTLIVLSVLLVFVVRFKIMTPYVRENEKRRFLEKSNLFSAIFENIDGLQVIKSFRLENTFKQRLAPKVISILNLQKRIQYIGLINSGVMGFVMIVANTLLIIFLSQHVITSHSISFGQLITFLALSRQIFSSVSNILEENLDIQENLVILTRYFDFGKNEIPESTVGRGNIKDFQINTIEFKSVCFHYSPRKPVISNLNVVINKGDRIHLKGSNGAGKSTFCKVLSLLYSPDAGEILVNNERLLFYNQASLRKKVLLVSNEDILFNDTVGYNITFDHDPDTERVLSLARHIGLHDFISGNEYGLDHIINEQGRNLSTGQRKKILLMRALLSDAEIIILDETLSGIDVKSRERIEDFINKEADRSFIIISHEPLSNINFSKTLILKDGNVEQLQYEWV